MTLLNDAWIRSAAADGMITPFQGSLVRELVVHKQDEDGAVWPDSVRKVISYGASSYGYDLRLSPKEFHTFLHLPGHIVDPKRFNPATLSQSTLYNDANGDSYFILPAHSYGLGVTVERLEIPEDVTCLFIGKSTYARCGIIANLTPGEAGWKGHLTLEISNSSGADCRVYANEGIVQALFFKGEPCETSYAKRSGKYQDQPEAVTTARI